MFHFWSFHVTVISSKRRDAGSFDLNRVIRSSLKGSFLSIRWMGKKWIEIVQSNCIPQHQNLIRQRQILSQALWYAQLQMRSKQSTSILRSVSN